MKHIRWVAGPVLAWVVSAAGAPPWHVIHVTIDPAGCERNDAVVDVAIDPKFLPTKAGLPLPLTRRCIDVVEVSRVGRLIDKQTPFQFDPIGGRGGTVTILLTGTTKPGAIRCYELRCRQAGKPFTVRPVRPRVELADDFEYKGQDSFRIVTPSAWWYYHKQGAGFAGLEDRDGKDWIGYRPTGGSDGKYRGIPNLVHPEGYFHPGGKKCRSRLVSSGPLKVIIDSQSLDKKWACRWEVCHAWARLTVLKAAGPYWFLYEGTPGGKLDADADCCITSAGKSTPAAKRWTGDLPAPEWVCFGDAKCKRALWLAHHEDDKHVDSYRPMQQNMTVFGFGRKDLTKHMTAVPNHFTVGLCESTDPKVIAAAVDAARRPCSIKLALRAGGR